MMVSFKIQVPGLVSRYAALTGNTAVKLYVDPDGEEPPGVHDYFGTEVANGEVSNSIGTRLKRCYELAATAVVVGTVPGNARVVHGSWHGPGAPERIGHAWVLIDDDLVWEPIRGLLFAREDFYAWTSARDEVEYDKRTLSRMLINHADFGRWHESRYP